MRTYQKLRTLRQQIQSKNRKSRVWTDTYRAAHLQLFRIPLTAVPEPDFLNAQWDTLAATIPTVSAISSRQDLSGQAAIVNMMFVMIAPPQKNSNGTDIRSGSRFQSSIRNRSENSFI